MPNFASCVLKVTGEKRHLDEFKSTIDGKFSLSQTVPRPEGPPTCEWAEENWGTKWDVAYPDVEIDDDGEIAIAFDTPWCPPFEWTKRVSPMFPRLRFQIAWSEIRVGDYGLVVAENGTYREYTCQVGDDIQPDEDGYPSPVGAYGEFLETYGTGTGG
jgi:hypothetical protein